MKLGIVASHPVQYYAPLYRELARQIDLTVFFAHQASPQQQSAAGFGVDFEWDIDLLGGFNNMFLPNAATDPGLHHFRSCDTPTLGQQLDSCGPFDCVLTMGWHLKTFWQGGFAAKRRSIPLLVRGDSHLETPRHWTKRAAKNMLYPMFLRLFDAALYVGKRNREYYRHYRYPEDRLFFSPHCVENARFAEGATPAARSALRENLSIGSDDLAVLFAGKLVEFKRPLDVLEAAVLVSRSLDRNVHVIVAGSGPLEIAMRSRAKDLGVRASFMSFQNQTQMPQVYAAADILALPSDGRETWGLVCNEALACGTPVVVSESVGCAPDLAGPEQVFAAGNIQAFAAAMLAVAQRPPPAQMMRRLSERYSVRTAASGIIEAAVRVQGEK